MKKTALLLSILALTSCSSNLAKPTKPTAPSGSTSNPFDTALSEELTQCENPNPNSQLLTRMAESDLALTAASRAADEMLRSQTIQGNNEWGKDGYIQSSKHRFVKYLDSFKTRADIHFDTGKIFVSTMDKEDPKAKLRRAIMQVVLLPPDPEHVDIFGSEQPKLGTTPFFLGQILDQNGKQMQTKEQAEHYADFLLANHLQQKKYLVGAAHYVEINLVENHEEIREYQFSEIVKAAAKRYNISEELIYAVIRTESSFNPYAVSHAGAIGLMQVVPTTAGADVFKLIKNKAGIPTKDYLFDPENNIDTGTAYLSILHERYLRNVTNKVNKHFASISAYNGGTGNVLISFDNNRTTAMEKINKTHPRQVYCILTQHHPKEESRNYLNKVLKAQHDFNINEI